MFFILLHEALKKKRSTQFLGVFCLLLKRAREQVVFSESYKVSQYNLCTSPYLDADAEAVRNDNGLKIEVAELKIQVL